MTSSSAYRDAGVDIEAKSGIIDRMRAAVRSTYGPEVLAGIGAFGGLFEITALKGMAAPVLVASTDGVGTKTVLANLLGRPDGLGADIVNHCVNDILVQGAEPLFFLDYIAMPRLVPEVLLAVVQSVSEACRAAGCALLGGETAEMPDVYAPGEMDLVGTIVGCVDRGRIIDGQTIREGDMLLGLASSGLHTNGYSLVRRLFNLRDLEGGQDLLERSLGEALLEPHLSYLPHVRAMRRAGTVKGLAHITGGGFQDNIPRILPEGLGVAVDTSAWEVPPLFGLIASAGDVARDEMYHVFNMGVGMVVIVSPDEADAVRAAAEGHGEAYVIGEVRSAVEGPRVALA